VRTLLKAPRGGFTLIEVMAAAAVTLIVITMALAVVHRVAAYQRRQQWVELTRRNTASALGQLTADIRRTGLGCPSSTRLTPAPGLRFPPTVLHATANELVLMADVPRPDRDLNGLSSLASDQGTFPPGRNWVVITNEQSGNCVPYNPTPAGRCTTNQSSLLFQGDSAHCGDDPTVRTCPWGLGRYRPGEQLIIFNGLGLWLQTTVDAAQLSTLQENRRSLLLNSAPAVSNAIMAGLTPGFVSTPDRIFYRLETTGSGATEHVRLVRRQCWESPLSDSTMDLNSLRSNCNSASTPWETLVEYDMPPAAPHVLNRPWQQTLQFTYHAANGVEVPRTPGPLYTEAQLRNIRQVRVIVQALRRPPASDARNQDFIEYNTRLTIDLRN
jgi:prepilin-type N-terminal cleavage/methylation domain-containing protein